MNGLNIIKNVMITALITTLYAIWSREQLHELSGLHMWTILLLVAALILHLLVWIDREIYHIQKERQGKVKKNRKQTVIIKHVKGEQNVINDAEVEC